MRTNQKELLITRREIDNNILSVCSVLSRLREKRQLNNDHLSRVRNLSPEEIVKDKSMVEINYMIQELEEIEQWNRSLLRKLI